MIILIFVVISLIGVELRDRFPPSIDQTVNRRQDPTLVSPRADSLPPGPRLAAVQLLNWTLRPGPWLEACWARYGDCFTVRMPRSDPLVFVTGPAALKAIFTGDPEVLRAAAREGIRPMFGARSILLLDGAEHLRERRLMLPPFHGARMTRYGELMTEITEREIDSWPVGGRLPFKAECKRSPWK